MTTLHPLATPLALLAGRRLSATARPIVIVFVLPFAATCLLALPLAAMPQMMRAQAAVIEIAQKTVVAERTRRPDVPIVEEDTSSDPPMRVPRTVADFAPCLAVPDACGPIVVAHAAGRGRLSAPPANDRLSTLFHSSTPGRAPPSAAIVG